MSEEFTPFPIELAPSETQTALFSVWTLVANSIFFDDNRYAMCSSNISVKPTNQPTNKILPKVIFYLIQYTARNDILWIVLILPSGLEQKYLVVSPQLHCLGECGDTKQP